MCAVYFPGTADAPCARLCTLTRGFRFVRRRKGGGSKKRVNKRRNAGGIRQAEMDGGSEMQLPSEGVHDGNRSDTVSNVRTNKSKSLAKSSTEHRALLQNENYEDDASGAECGEAQGMSKKEEEGRASVVRQGTEHRALLQNENHEDNASGAECGEAQGMSKKEREGRASVHQAGSKAQNGAASLTVAAAAAQAAVAAGDERLKACMSTLERATVRRKEVLDRSRAERKAAAAKQEERLESLERTRADNLRRSGEKQAAILKSQEAAEKRRENMILQRVRRTHHMNEAAGFTASKAATGEIIAENAERAEVEEHAKFETARKLRDRQTEMKRENAKQMASRVDAAASVRASKERERIAQLVARSKGTADDGCGHEDRLRRQRDLHDAERAAEAERRKRRHDEASVRREAILNELRVRGGQRRASQEANALLVARRKRSDDEARAAKAAARQKREADAAERRNRREEEARVAVAVNHASAFEAAERRRLTGQLAANQEANQCRQRWRAGVDADSEKENVHAKLEEEERARSAVVAKLVSAEQRRSLELEKRRSDAKRHVDLVTERVERRELDEMERLESGREALKITVGLVANNVQRENLFHKVAAVDIGAASASLSLTPTAAEVAARRKRDAERRSAVEIRRASVRDAEEAGLQERSQELEERLRDADSRRAEQMLLRSPKKRPRPNSAASDSGKISTITTEQTAEGTQQPPLNHAAPAVTKPSQIVGAPGSDSCDPKPGGTAHVTSSGLSVPSLESPAELARKIAERRKTLAERRSEVARRREERDREEARAKLAVEHELEEQKALETRVASAEIAKRREEREQRHRLYELRRRNREAVLQLERREDEARRAAKEKKRQDDAARRRREKARAKRKASLAAAQSIRRARGVGNVTADSSVDGGEAPGDARAVTAADQSAVLLPRPPPPPTFGQVADDGSSMARSDGPSPSSTLTSQARDVSVSSGTRTTRGGEADEEASTFPPPPQRIALGDVSSATRMLLSRTGDSVAHLLRQLDVDASRVSSLRSLERIAAKLAAQANAMLRSRETSIARDDDDLRRLYSLLDTAEARVGVLEG